MQSGSSASEPHVYRLVALAPSPARIRWVPESHDSRFADVRDVVDLFPYKFDDWQMEVLEGLSGVEKDGKWSAFEGGMCIPRQNGKDAILEALELTGLFAWDERLIIHSAHEFATSQEHFRRLLYVIEEVPDFDKQVKRVTRSHGEEGIELRNSCRIRFRTRTKGGGRGFSCDRLVGNEAMVLPEAMHGALLPTMRARPNPQIIYAGSAVDQETQADGVVFARLRERGIKQERGVAYFEWSLPYETPDEVPGEVMDDHESWAQSNPALGVRIFAEHMELERESLSDRMFCVELLGVGDWPRTDGRSDMAVTPEQWADCEDKMSRFLPPAVIAFDVSPERRATIAAAGIREDGRYHVEVIEKQGGTAWLPARLAQIVEDHEPIIVRADKLGPSASLLAKIEDLDVKVELIDGPQHARACGMFVDAVREDRLRHLGSMDLANAIRGAATRPLGDSWAWSRKASSVDISPLVAVTLALQGMMNEPDDRELVIY